jgi:hypothetical protein
MPHGNAVIDGNGIEFGRKTAQFLDFFFDGLADIMQVYMTGNKLSEGINNADDRFAELFFGHAIGPPETSGTSHQPAFGSC